MKKTAAIIFALATFACRGGNGDFDASGRFEATEVVVSAEASGRITGFDVQEGDSLAAGQPVGYIDSIQYSLRVRQLKASIGGVDSRRVDIRKQIAVTEQQIATQQIEKRRVEQLLSANAANRKQLDDINAQIELLQRQLAAQRSTLESTNRSLSSDAEALLIQMEQAEDQLAKCYIVSPVSGTVLAKYAQAGEMATVGRPLFKVADLGDMYLRAYVTADQLTQLKLGQQVKVYSDFGKNGQREYAGRIVWISGESEFTPKSVQTRDERADLVYAMKVAVSNDGYLKIGMYGQMKLADDASR